MDNVNSTLYIPLYGKAKVSRGAGRSAVDTNDLEKQLEALQAQLRQTLGTKVCLERQMDGLDISDPYYSRKSSRMATGSGRLSSTSPFLSTGQK